MTAPRFDAFALFSIQRRDARRQAIPETGTPPVAEWDGDKTPYLFVQSFRSGSLTPTDDPDKRTLTLAAGRPPTSQQARGRPAMWPAA
jgi:hypothetical protein